MTKSLLTFQTKFILFLSTAVLSFNISLLASAKGPGKFIHCDRNPVDKPGNYSVSDLLLAINNPAYQIKTVVIDAGHGGHDPGCHGASAHEKHVTLAIAKRLGELLRQRYPNLNVILTRDSDVFIPLYERAEIANKNNADLFISIHCNAMPGNNSGTYGTETYVMGLHTAQYNLEVAKRENAAILLEDNYQKNYDYDPNTPEGHIMISMFQNAYLKQSLQFAELVESKLHIQASRKSRGVKQAGFVVLKATAMPSVLVEVGFLTNPTEEKYLYSQAGQDQVANSLLEAFDEYKRSAESSEYYAETQFGTGEPKETQIKPIKESGPVYAYGSSNERLGSQAQNDNQRTELTKSREIPAPARANDPGGNPTGNISGNKAISEAPTRYYGPVPTSGNPNRSPGTSYQYSSSTGNLQKLPANPLPETSNPAIPKVTFKIQLAAGAVMPNPSENKWKTFPYPIEVMQEDNLYKVRTKAYSDYEEANEVRRKCKDLGFGDAFIVAIKDGKRISLPEAKKALGIP